MKLTDSLDVIGVVCLALFAYSLFPSAALAVVGVAALLISWRRS